MVMIIIAGVVDRFEVDGFSSRPVLAFLRDYWVLSYGKPLSALIFCLQPAVCQDPCGCFRSEHTMVPQIVFFLFLFLIVSTV